VFAGIGGGDALAGEVTHEAAGEAVARAGGVEDLLEQIAGGDEVVIGCEEDGAVFAAFDDEDLGAHVHDDGGGLFEVRFAGEHAGFAVVDEEEVPALEGFEQGGAGDVDPEIHGVAAGEAGLLHLVADAFLEGGLDVAEEEVGGVFVGGGEFGVEVGEDVEVGDECGAVVHVVGVDALPEEGFAGDALEAFDADVAGGEEVDVGLGKVVADDADDVDGGEVGGREGDVSAGAAEHAVDGAVGGLNAVVCDGADDDKRHRSIVAGGVGRGPGNGREHGAAVQRGRIH